MEIPETGAVFTLGRSYLAENIGTVLHRQQSAYQNSPRTTDQSQNEPSNGTGNGMTLGIGSAMMAATIAGMQMHRAGLSPASQQPPKTPVQQSYFFIKNDPVAKIVCGNKQSGVICESGRLFVWGKNHYGQLGLGSTDVCVKPSCVRTMKKYKLQVKDARFGGNGYGLILTACGKVFYSGKIVFPFNAKVASLLEAPSLRKNTSDNSEYTHLPVELTEFNVCLEKEDEKVIDLAAGFCHFVARTSAGNCFGWGYNSHQQLGGVDSLKILTRPDRIGVEERVELVVCGNYCTLMVSESNRVYLAGKYQKITIPVVKELEVELPSKVVGAKITKNDLIYLLLEDNQVYRSNRVHKISELRFDRMDLLDQLLRKNEVITQVAPANNFTSFVTSEGRLLTTYDNHSPFTPSDHIRELTKFKEYLVANVASGLEHSLILAFPRKKRMPSIEIDYCDAVQAIEASINNEEQKARKPTPMPSSPGVELSQEMIRQEKRRLRQEKIARELSKDECIEIETTADEVRFIDNGIDITSMVISSEDIDQNAILEEHQMNEKNQRLDPRYAYHKTVAMDQLMHSKTPTPNISQLIDYSDGENGSISSQSTFEDEDSSTEPYSPPVQATNVNNGKNGTGDPNNNNQTKNGKDRKHSLESKMKNGSNGSVKSSGKVKKFLKDLKTRSLDVTCRNAGKVLNDDSKYAKDDHAIRDRSSKVCSIM
ncbi:X-linked retinitis pigmentosa GTPase regulator [Uranotaenia lowii]|uniref:X-linked retinitis pigmentosa GTPase regulator n=1 Tax=Uranotaenia lowii TaxID=190385 RepID=UPI0024783418|nr:X-linked retinitis pigmentosa GTPase regulator [Uranotaenia lowii]XP_055612013.1 X-linked retinitis pigmentosa GTPase regulator [Uranotaenia lowii]